MATDLVERGHALFMQNSCDERICGENFSATTGRAADQPVTDFFCTGGRSMAAVAVAEISDMNPWQGWTATSTRRCLTDGDHGHGVA
ncbi:MAG: hypothetical protein GDA49_02465 [Rhodospirillales bacterium]|nr:hypothetical protein [Rhodospirillales bacterium]